ncbi:MAG: GDP-L-fucose synthase [Bacteroidales bacterium]|jgi:GDP-L-fucose synthase|nr:GDP-L-fucose synthase [Bacteroidales bacterium]
MEKHSKIYVAGHTGLVGSAIVRYLQKNGYKNLICKDIKDLDLRRQQPVEEFFAREQPDYVFLSAAKVGGILANNTYPAQFLYDNLMITTNIIHSAYLYSVKKLLFLGSSCIYPKMATQPIKEGSLLTGSLEPTNEAYAIAKISGLELCKFYRREYGCNFISAMPTNLYGINDNFDLENSHVLPAMIRKFHEAKLAGKEEVVLWGTGTPMREFLYVDDLADALLFLMQNYAEEEPINIGPGVDITISELADIVKEITGYTGKIVYDTTKPDGTPRKWLDISKIYDLGWKYKTELEEGIGKVYEWYKLFEK